MNKTKTEDYLINHIAGYRLIYNLSETEVNALIHWYILKPLRS
jgi:hypothetical protein